MFEVVVGWMVTMLMLVCGLLYVIGVWCGFFLVECVFI